MNCLSNYIILILATACLTVSLHADELSNSQKVKLIFSLDQGFGNGVVIQNDQTAIRRIIKTIKPLTLKFDVYLLLNPQIKNKTIFQNTLNTVQKYEMPFVLDVYTSDAYTLGSAASHNNLFDASHAISISIEYLEYLKEKYGDYFAGIRFMEIFGQDFTVRCIKTTNPEWARPTDRLPDDNIFSINRAELFMKFAYDNKMFLQWADFHWYKAAIWDDTQRLYENKLADLFKKYPGTAIITYNNNEPLEQSVSKIDSWHAILTDLITEGVNGYGLSDQSWIRSDHMNTSADEIAKWAESALKNKSKIIQFEPVWYFFNLPTGTFELNDHTDLPEWKFRGYGRSAFYRLNDLLMNQ